MKVTFSKLGGPIVIGVLWLGLHGNGACAKDRFTAEFHQTYALASEGQVRLENVNGFVHFTTWDRAEVQVDAVRRADSQADLDALKIEVDSKPDRIRIVTKYPNSKSGWKLWNWGNHSASVDYEIKLPAHSRLEDVQTVNGSIAVRDLNGDAHVSTVNGKLELQAVRGKVHATTVNGALVAKGLAADAHLETVNGGIEAVFEQLDAVKSASFKTVNGGVEVSLPPNANATVSAHTLNGGLHADPGLTVKKNWPVGKELHGTLGTGSAQIAAETVNGGIRFHNPPAVQPVSAERTE